jgi:peroxiredoxin
MMPMEERTASRFSPGLIVIGALALVGIVTAVLMFASGGAPPVEPTPAPVSLPSRGQVINAPSLDFTLSTPDGRTLSLSNFRGRVVFLNFWATWCGPCERELPALQTFARQQMTLPDGAVVLAVNFQEDTETVTRFLSARGIDSLLVLMDSDARVSDQYGVFNLPVTFVIDRDGIVRYPKYGEVKLDELYAYLDALAGEEEAGT